MLSVIWTKKRTQTRKKNQKCKTIIIESGETKKKEVTQKGEEIEKDRGLACTTGDKVG